MSAIKSCFLSTAFLVLAGCSSTRDPSAEAMALNNVGLSYMQEGDFRTAILCFEKALEIQPNLGVAHLNLGVVYQDTGAFQQAQRHYQLAILHGALFASRPLTAEASGEFGAPTIAGFSVRKMSELPPRVAGDWVKIPARFLVH